MKTGLSVFTLVMFCAALTVSGQETATKKKPSPADGKAQQDGAVDEVAADIPAALNFKVKSIDGAEVDMTKYAGKVVVVVNTASKCGMTPQYEQLQELHTKFAEKGVKVLGFPCNQFGGQEPGSESDIKSFCTKNYGVTFDMFSKVDVNGDDANAFFKHLKEQELPPKGKGDVRWNFEKFVLDKTGKPIARFGSRVKPDSEEFMNVIKKALEE